MKGRSIGLMNATIYQNVFRAKAIRFRGVTMYIPECVSAAQHGNEEDKMAI